MNNATCAEWCDTATCSSFDSADCDKIMASKTVVAQKDTIASAASIGITPFFSVLAITFATMAMTALAPVMW